MKKLGRRIETQGMTFLRAAGVMAITLAFAFGLARGAAGRAQSEGTATYPPGYEFDVATIYLSTDARPGGVVGFLTDDSYRARNMTMRFIIRNAYDLWGGREEMVIGGPKWLDTDGYYITAKMDAAVADKLKKLSPDERKLTQDQMVRALLGDRFKLQTHREAKQFPVYEMTIAKTGLKLHEAKPGDTYDHALQGGPGKPGGIIDIIGSEPAGTTMTIYGFGVSMSALAHDLGTKAGQIVQDKTGLTGSYDFTLKYWVNFIRLGTDGPPDAQSAIAAAAAEPAGGPSLFTAIQQQLGLKLDSTKGPLEIVVIDHIERPSGN
jgi:uncharacterized protein (TIGR03435 family)